MKIRITFYACVMTFIWSSFLIVLIYILRNRLHLTQLCSIGSIIAVYAFCAVRMLIPVEFSWTRGISAPWLMNPIDKICHKKIVFPSETVLFGYEILIGIWILGSLILTAVFTAAYISTYHVLNRFPKVENEQDKRILSTVHSGKEIQIFESCAVETPFGYGIIHPEILLPKQVYTEEERYFIILHEATHHRNRDLLSKLLINSFCTFFWWNPFSWLLKKDVDQMFELRCDRTVIQNLGKKERKQYLMTLLRIYKESKHRTKPLETAALIQGRTTQIEERFLAVKDYKKANRVLSSAGVLILTGVILLASYSFAFQQSYEPSEIKNEISPENSYIVKRGGVWHLFSTGSGMVAPLTTEKVKKLMKEGFHRECD